MTRRTVSGPDPLPGLEPAVTLTPRQAFALQIIREHAPIQSVELGAYLHEYRRNHGGRGHASDVCCEFCQTEGASVAGALRKKGLVKQRRGEGWYVPGERKPAEPEEPFEWPEGF